MTAQRNSQNGRMKAAEHVEHLDATEDTKIETTPKALFAMIGACCVAAVMWVTLSITVNAHGAKIEKQEVYQGDMSVKLTATTRQLEKLDDRTAALEAWRREMELQRDDIRATRKMVEDLTKKIKAQGQ